MSNSERFDQKELEKLRSLIKGIDTAMLTTMTDEGLVSRPMKTQEVEFDGDLWFFTKKDTDKFHEVLQNQEVNVAYAGKSYVSVRGKAEIVESLDKKKELWNAAYEKLLKTSYDDPNVVLLKVEVESAEYWESGNLMKMVVHLFNRAAGKEKDTANINQTID
ncbi:pyridoxamine 5'-phosphate oxidase family protein [Heyndrickxia acidiproducens]|uniref:pyridoxamine 5'-phosphate oxidase family protein n=1 Tax=Heyndrickxia acidiproducens TaxID=1121084 RepID=UPI000380E50D|nr:pyridoxamine 5'-phosphate oxidase family protein [Heyndrickxia acidiproducens]